jgi:hypothetical protein
MMRILSVALAVLAAAACSSTSLPGDRDGDPRLEFTAEADPRRYLFPTPRATVEPTAGGVAVATMMTHPVGCREFGAELDGSGRVLELNVSIIPTRTFVACAGGSANYTYTAQVRDLAPGSYRLVVRHVYPEGDYPGHVVLNTEITVD